MYIVTGGAGLIGSACVWALNQRGIDNIIIVDHLSNTDKWKNLRALKYLQYYEKEDFLARIQSGEFRNIDAIIHMGACSATTETDASYLVANNLHYSQTLALWAVKNSIRFVYASSAATYGDGEHGFDDSLDKLDQYRPLNMYGYSKHFFDQWAKKNNLFDKICGLKFSNVFGPNENHKANMRSVVKRAFEQISANGTMELFKSYRPEYKDGEQMRDFVYVKDVAEIIMFLTENSKVNGLFNVGCGEANTWNTLVSYVFEALEKPTSIKYIEMPESLRPKYQYYTESKIDKLRVAGFEKKLLPLRLAVKDYVQNYLQSDKFLGDE